uniref:E3 ubiquitin-protein ligase UPL2-like n=1 Tax=Tanacetum cinerariifolium TaxID=118510 RepID=A0A6L2KNG7_TANCI|nr:E3 ubiquitin-protein ligase UPL2-like [Tanacetum cinerariifolium]
MLKLKTSLVSSKELAGRVLETTAYTNGDRYHADTHDSGNTPTIDESQGGRVRMPQCVDMHFEQNYGVACDVEAVSQESRGSGATLGESLRSLDVDIGSADGQDDGGERQGPRRINASLGYTSDEPRDGVAGSALIDTAFLDALPEKLRAEVLSGLQGQVAQPLNIDPQNDGDIDPEFLAALPPAIRVDVLAQQQAQGVYRSCELEGQTAEMDTVSINATFPDLRGCLDLIINNQIFSCNKRVRPAVEGRRTVWLTQDVGASTTTVDHSNAKLLDVYRVTDMRSNEKLLDGKFEFQLRLQEFIEMGSGANKLPAVKPPHGVSAAKQIEVNDEPVKTKLASFIMGQRRLRIVLLGMHGYFKNSNQGTAHPKVSYAMPQIYKLYCPKCGHPVDGHYCQGCALLQKKFKEDMFTSCVENGILQDPFKPSNDNTNVVNALRESFVVNQDPGKNSSQSPPQINHHCCYSCGDSLEGIFCHKCTCELCGNGAHYGYNCLPKVLIVPNPEPFNNQTSKKFPPTMPSFDSTCYSENRNSFTYDSTSNLVHDSPNIRACCDDDDDDYTFAITPNEPNNSLSMGDEHLDTILATELDEFIKSSVENLVPNLSESEGEHECDVPTCEVFTTFFNILFDADYDFYYVDDQSFSDEDIPKKIYSNPLFDEEILSMKIDPHQFNAESDLIESLLNHDSSIISFSSKIDSLFDEFADELTLLKSISPGVNEIDCDPEEETHFIKRLLYDNSSSRPSEEFISENFDTAVESFSPSPILVEDSDSLMKEIDLSFTLDDPMPPGIEEDDYDSEKDILILEEFLSNDSLSLPENESFHFDIHSSSRPPAKRPNGNTGILNVKMMGDISEHEVPMPKLMSTQSILDPNQEKSPELLPHLGHETF